MFTANTTGFLDRCSIPATSWSAAVLPVRIGAVGDLAVTRLLLAEKVTHTFEGEDHTMKIEVRSFDQLGGVSVV